MSENTTAATVTRTLANHPDGITVRDLATEAGVGQSTAAKTLAAMETAGTATRTPGPANGNRKGADIWRLVADDTATPDEAPVADDATATVTADEPLVADDATATVTEPPIADDATVTTGEAPVADDATATVTADEEPVADDATADEPPVADDAPVPAAPREPDLKVMIMAGVLGDHPDGVEATTAIAESGLAPAIGDTILAAMEVAGVARRLPVGEDGVELWVRGDGDLATVDPANAPTHVTCPTCGHTRRVRRPSATGRRTGGGTGRATGEINTDGSVKLAKGELERLVEAFIRDLGPGHELTPVTAGRELGGRSSGACGNAMDKLTARGVLVLTSEVPRRFALADNAPPPSAEVLAHMTSRAAVTTDTTTTTDAAPETRAA